MIKCQFFFAFLQNGSKELSNFCMIVEDIYGALFKPDSFSEKILNHKS